MKYLAVLGRQPEISVAELESLFGEMKQISDSLASFSSASPVDINFLGGTLKLATKLRQKPLDYLAGLPDGKITFGISDFSTKASKKTAQLEALKLKKILVRHGRSVRVVENKDAVLSTATSLHNGLSGKNERKIELIKVNDEWFKVVGVQDIDTYMKRDQNRPARDAKVGMLPPKLAQILISLCGPLEPGSVVLDPFCGTGVVLQEALLMGYQAYGTDISDRMVDYSKRNLEWLKNQNYLATNMSRTAKLAGRERALCEDGRASRFGAKQFWFSVGDATSFKWSHPIDAVACESYLGKPFSKIPTAIELKAQKQECSNIILGFLGNLASQIKPNTPVTIAIPAWFRESGDYERLEIVDEIAKLGYNVNNKSRDGLLYHREGQVVARDIIILRKK